MHRLGNRHQTIDPITHLVLHQIARASRFPQTEAMTAFLAGLPSLSCVATPDEIDAFDTLLDEMEEGPRL